MAGRIAHTHGSDGTQLFYTYDEKGNTKTVLAKQNSTTLSNAEYIYGTDNLLTQVKLKSMHNGSINYTYDSINRLANTVHTPMSGTPAVTFKTSNAYLMVGDNRTGLIAQKIYAKIDSTSGTAVTTQHGKLNYTYDSLGNIKTIKENDVLKATYTYDGLNQLIREDNVWLNKSVTYTYDQGGNILAKSEYAYTTGTLGTVQSTVNYTYADTNWKDKLTAYNGQAITYDQIGNPLGYRGYTLNWQGRRLYSLSGNGVTASYKYNSSGLRSQKVSNGTTTDYTYAGGALVSQTDGTDTLNYLYSPDGQMIGVSRNGYNYYYMRNAQGDVIALYNCYGDINSRYVYDSWGRLLSVTNASGTPITDQTHIAHVNPIRYRGYYYDKETGLFYVGSRYYDPEIGRFINADDVDILDGGNDHMLENNLFAYCFNNPVNMTDEDGQWPKWATKVLIGVAVIAAVAVVTVATGGAGAGVAGFIAAGALKGAVIGAASGAVIGGGLGAVSHRVSTGSWKGAGNAALNGAADGFMTGAISGAITGGAGRATQVLRNTKVTGSLGKTGKPMSSQSLVKNGKVTNTRFYNAKGKATFQLDYTNHGYPKYHSIPHGHSINFSNPKPWSNPINNLWKSRW